MSAYMGNWNKKSVFPEEVSYNIRNGLTENTVPTKKREKSKKFLGEAEVSTIFCKVIVTQESWKLNIFI